MTVSYSDVVFAFDMNRIETILGVRYLFDYGPNQFSFAFPGGAADPTPTLTGELSFDGGDYLSYTGDLARFYTAMPAGSCTLFYATTMTTTGVRTLFSCESIGANNRGMRFGSATAAIYEFYQFQNTAALPAIQPTGHALSRSHVCAITMEATPRFLRDQSVGTAAWAGGAFGTCVYNAATIPRIGSTPGGGQFWLGPIRYLCLVRGAVASPDLMQLSRLIVEGSTKPFCVRQ